MLEDFGETAGLEMNEAARGMAQARRGLPDISGQLAGQYPRFKGNNSTW